MPARFTFPQAVEETARSKHAAASARSQGGPGAPPPREVIAGACARIGEALAEDGFTFLRSGPRLKRVRGDLTDDISFQSDRNNIAGRRAVVWIHGGTSSNRLKAWRRSHPHPWIQDKRPNAGRIDGGQIGNLTDAPTWMQWDFADPSERENEIADAVATIRDILLPFFDSFDAPAQAVEVRLPLSMFSHASLLSYALIALDHTAAEEIGRRFLRSNPAFRARFEHALSDIRANGLPTHRSNEAVDLAAFAVAAGLVLTPVD